MVLMLLLLLLLLTLKHLLPLLERSLSSGGLLLMDARIDTSCLVCSGRKGHLLSTKCTWVNKLGLVSLRGHDVGI